MEVGGCDASALVNIFNIVPQTQRGDGHLPDFKFDQGEQTWHRGLCTCVCLCVRDREVL